MATFRELAQINVREIDAKGMMQFDMDMFAEHVPADISARNETFIRQNPGLPGLLDFQVGGWTEPEDERDVIANNQALSRIDEVMPILHRMNKHLDTNQLNNDNYSTRVLHIADEVLMAKDAGLEGSKLDYLIDEAAKKDIQGEYVSFGWKHHEYESCDARWKFELGMTVQEVRKLQNVPSHVKSVVDMYTMNGKYTQEGIDWIINTRNSDEAYSMSDLIAHGGKTNEQIQTIHDCVERLYAAAEDPVKNVQVDEVWKGFDGEPDETHQLQRFSVEYGGGYVDDLRRMMDLYPEVEKNPEKLTAFTEKFIDEGAPHRWVSAYAEQLAQEGHLRFDAPQSESAPMNQLEIECGKGLCGAPFEAKNGQNYVQVKIPNTPHKIWPTFVVPADQVRESDATHMTVTIPKDGTTRVRYTKVVGEDENGGKIYDSQYRQMDNGELKALMEPSQKAKSYTPTGDVAKYMDEADTPEMREMSYYDALSDLQGYC